MPSCSEPPTPTPGETLTLICAPPLCTFLSSASLVTTINVEAAQAVPPAIPGPAAMPLTGSTGPIGLFTKSPVSSDSLSDEAATTSLLRFLSTSLNVASKAALAAAAFSASVFCLASSACFIHIGFEAAVFLSAINSKTPKLLEQSNKQ
ncbi:hypothetical protein V6Z12_D10G153000 [Gossypium hirsutum]